MDDVWASDEELSAYDREIAQREWERLNVNHGNEGYKEGIVAGKELKMQQGFDKGYIEGFSVGKSLGILRGRLSTYMTLYGTILHDEERAQKIRQLYDELKAVDVQHVFSKEYFEGKVEEIEQPKDVLVHWEEKVDSLLKSLEL